MIESSIIISLLLIGGMFFAARLAKENARKNPAKEKARLLESLAWHEKRLARAKADNWDEHMLAGVEHQLHEVRTRLAEIAAAEAPAAQRNSA